jgi:hypothetical protein
MNPGCWKLLMIDYKTYVPQCLVIKFTSKIKSMPCDGFNPSTPKKKVVKPVTTVLPFPYLYLLKNVLPPMIGAEEVDGMR